MSQLLEGPSKQVYSEPHELLLCWSLTLKAFASFKTREASLDTCLTFSTGHLKTKKVPECMSAVKTLHPFTADFVFQIVTFQPKKSENTLHLWCPTALGLQE